jgi:hypothetical protein
VTRPLTLIATFLAVLLLACYAETGKAHPHRGVPASGKPHDRAAWLRSAVAYHRHVATYGGGAHRRWHQRALRWSSRELREAEQDAWRYDHAVPEWPWLALARCEQRGSGWAGINWAAYSQSYEGAYGFLHATWRQYRYPWMPRRADLATPREQTLVAIRLRDRFGGYSSWPACSIRLGLR